MLIPTMQIDHLTARFAAASYQLVGEMHRAAADMRRVAEHSRSVLDRARSLLAEADTHRLDWTARALLAEGVGIRT